MVTDETKVAGSDVRVQAYVLQPSTKRTPNGSACREMPGSRADSDGSGPNQRVLILAANLSNACFLTTQDGQSTEENGERSAGQVLQTCKVRSDDLLTHDLLTWDLAESKGTVHAPHSS